MQKVKELQLENSSTFIELEAQQLCQQEAASRSRFHFNIILPSTSRSLAEWTVYNLRPLLCALHVSHWFHSLHSNWHSVIFCLLGCSTWTPHSHTTSIYVLSFVWQFCTLPGGDNTFCSLFLRECSCLPQIFEFCKIFSSMYGAIRIREMQTTEGEARSGIKCWWGAQCADTDSNSPNGQGWETAFTAGSLFG
jgi:hypothetical protein